MSNDYVAWGPPNPPLYRTPDPFTWKTVIGGLAVLLAFGFLAAMVVILVISLVMVSIAVPPVGIALAKAAVGG